MQTLLQSIQNINEWELLFHFKQAIRQQQHEACWAIKEESYVF